VGEVIRLDKYRGMRAGRSSGVDVKVGDPQDPDAIRFFAPHERIIVLESRPSRGMFYSRPKKVEGLGLARMFGVQDLEDILEVKKGLSLILDEGRVYSTMLSRIPKISSVYRLGIELTDVPTNTEVTARISSDKRAHSKGLRDGSMVIFNDWRDGQNEGEMGLYVRSDISELSRVAVSFGSRRMLRSL
jgi:hypothetical protein